MARCRACQDEARRAVSSGRQRPQRFDATAIQRRPAADPTPPQEDDERGLAVQARQRGGPVSGAIDPRTASAHLGQGEPLPTSVRPSMEQAFGADFSAVRVHRDDRAASLTRAVSAEALTVGPHIAFGRGRFDPSSRTGRHLLAHELTHVLQQGRGLSGAILQRGQGSPGDAWEREAETVAARVAAGGDSELAGRAPGSEDAPAIQAFSGSAAASYARTWATSRNPAYVAFDNDCTNFVSQAMEAGGWTQIVGAGYCEDRASSSVWWHKKDGCDRTWPIPNVHASHTWGGAENFYWFARNSARGTAAARVMDLREGDVLQADWSGGGTINHSMVVTKKTSDNLYLSYHSTDRLDRPFYGEGGIYPDHPDPPTKYYAWRM